MTDLDDFLATIMENPDDDAPRLVLADYLEEHGQEELGQFIRHQIRLSRMDILDPKYPQEMAAMYRSGVYDHAGRVPYLDYLPNTNAKIQFRRGLIGHLYFDSVPRGIDPELSKVPIQAITCSIPLQYVHIENHISYWRQFPHVKELEIWLDPADTEFQPQILLRLFGSDGPFVNLEKLALGCVDRSVFIEGVIPNLHLPRLKTFCLYSDPFSRLGEFDVASGGTEWTWLGLPDYLPRNAFPNSPLEEFVWKSFDSFEYWYNESNEMRVDWPGPCLASLQRLPQFSNLKRCDIFTKLLAMQEVRFLPYEDSIPAHLNAVSLRGSDLDRLSEDATHPIKHLRIYPNNQFFQRKHSFPNLETLDIVSNFIESEDWRSSFVVKPQELLVWPLHGSLKHIDRSQIHTMTIDGWEPRVVEFLDLDWNELRHLKSHQFTEFESHFGQSHMPNLVTLNLTGSRERRKFRKALLEITNKPHLSFVNDGMEKFIFEGRGSGKRFHNCHKRFDFTEPDMLKRFYADLNQYYPF